MLVHGTLFFKGLPVLTPPSTDFISSAAAWRERAQTLLDTTGDDPLSLTELVHDGIALRRRADLVLTDAGPRRELLPVLAAAKQVCESVSIDWLAGDQGLRREPLIAHVLRLLDLDQRFLAALLASTPQECEGAARAIDAFRDDLSWSASLVAVLDGGKVPDALSLLLSEQERLLNSLEESGGDCDRGLDGSNHQAGGDGSQLAQPEIEHLRANAERLRAQALAGMVRALTAQSAADGWQQQYQRWQSASRLAGHLSVASNSTSCQTTSGAGAIAVSGQQELLAKTLQARASAVANWQATVAGLSGDQRAAALDRIATELLDRASDTMTFLEDLPLAEEVRSLELLRDDLDPALAAVTAAADRPGLRDAESGGESDGLLQRLRRSLRRRLNAVTAELQDRQLAWRLESLFGPRAVAAWERFVLFTLILFVCLLAAEGPLVRMEGDPAHQGLVEIVFAWIDLGVCAVFLLDFFVKLTLAENRARYLWRNWLTGLLPSLPFGFFAYATHHLAAADAADRLVLLRFLRYARLPQMARWLRAARPAVRALRLVAFALRAGDRLMRQLTPVVNRNLVLFERAAIEVEEPKYRVELAALREQFIYRTPAVWEQLNPIAQRRVAAARLEDLAAILPALRADWVPAAQVDVATAREIPVESVVVRLLTTTPAQVVDAVGVNVAQSVRRWCRSLDVAGIRRLPGARSLVAAGRHADPAEATAHAANYVGMSLKRLLDRVYWAADLYGTVTAPQLVDSLGVWLVKGASRPARRLLLLGTLLLIVSQIALLLPSQALDDLVRSFKRLVATPLIVLGTICLAFLGVGVWFRRIASQATEFYEHVAEAQYINALKGLKRQLASRHYSLLEQNVIQPERRLSPVVNSECEPPASRIESDILAIWNDYLDAAPFHKRDAKTTMQLLGNLVLVSLRETRLNYTRRQRKRLRQLNLDQAYGGLRGPYLWFRFISRSVSQQTAKLVVDYNAHVLPLSRAATAPDVAVVRYADWLAGRLGAQPPRTVLPCEFHERERTVRNWRSGAGPAGAEDRQAPWDFQGNDFTAMHFLSADSELEQDIRCRYGDTIADLMRRDRRDNIRRVFRTFPFHHWPKDRRTFNPLLVYQQHWAGGRALLLPLKLSMWSCVLLIRLMRKLAAVVGDVLQPTDVEVTGLTESDPFAVAVRKIHRMRQPVFLECLRMRAQFDPEYLGVALPESDRSNDPLTSPVERDLACIDADQRIEQELRQMAVQRRRQMDDFRNWLKRFGWRCQTDEACRAMAIAYAIDFQGLRRRLEATDFLSNAFATIADPQAPPPPSGRGVVRRLQSLLPQRQLRGRFERLFSQPAFRHMTAQQRAICRKQVENQRGSLLAAVITLTAYAGVDDPVEDAQQRLAAVSRDPSTWSRQLAVLRAVQTLTVIDLQMYCDLVHELGEYGSQ